MHTRSKAFIGLSAEWSSTFTMSLRTVDDHSGAVKNPDGGRGDKKRQHCYQRVQENP